MMSLPLLKRMMGASVKEWINSCLQAVGGTALSLILRRMTTKYYGNNGAVLTLEPEMKKLVTLMKATVRGQRRGGRGDEESRGDRGG